jgi:hypothetical protein
MIVRLPRLTTGKVPDHLTTELCVLLDAAAEEFEESPNLITGHSLDLAQAKFNKQLLTIGRVATDEDIVLFLVVVSLPVVVSYPIVKTEQESQLQQDPADSILFNYLSSRILACNLSMDSSFFTLSNSASDFCSSTLYLELSSTGPQGFLSWTF